MKNLTLARTQTQVLGISSADIYIYTYTLVYICLIVYYIHIYICVYNTISNIYIPEYTVSMLDTVKLTSSIVQTINVKQSIINVKHSTIIAKWSIGNCRQVEYRQSLSNRIQSVNAMPSIIMVKCIIDSRH